MGTPSRLSGQPSGQTTEYDVFVIYSRKDRKFAEHLVNDLEENGIRTYVDFKDLLPGEVWNVVLPEAMINSKILVALLSPNSISSEYVQLDLKTALANNKRIIPVLCQAIDFSKLKATDLEQLINIHFLDMSQEYAGKLSQLIKAIQSFLQGKPEKAPSQPSGEQF